MITMVRMIMNHWKEMKVKILIGFMTKGSFRLQQRDNQSQSNNCVQTGGTLLWKVCTEGNLEYLSMFFFSDK